MFTYGFTQSPPLLRKFINGVENVSKLALHRLKVNGSFLVAYNLLRRYEEKKKEVSFF
ncbi:hypothetical protein NIASO_04290 [Niabella soli DSM 19437]|uniref:Uncharacterized protein n=1 Tax=Niabella soli DSM 19437 TaxID=929713 RepID=W0F2J4_9BACT|nr:hypothetical protein NIASO_04290 [Niabella soli DSM 19437]